LGRFVNAGNGLLILSGKVRETSGTSAIPRSFLQKTMKIKATSTKLLRISTLAILVAATPAASAAVLSNFTFTGPPWTTNKDNNFATFAANAPSSDTELNSTTSILSNSGYNGGTYASFYIRDIDGGTVGVADAGDFTIFSTSATPGAGMNVGNAAATVATNYIAFTLTPDSGYQTAFESLSFYTGTNAASDEYNIQLRAWNGVSETTLGSVSHTGASTNAPVVFKSIDFTDFTSTSAIEFRLYGYNVASSGGGIRYDDIVLNGTTTAIPEPSMAALCGLAAMGLLVRRRR
jgi:hypothetical protein